MKTAKSLSILGCLLGLLLPLLTFSGCASLDAPNQASLLTAAGFRTRIPETPKQKELYGAAEPYKLLSFSVKGKILYAYKDEKKGVAYIGGEAEHSRYQQL